MVREGMFATQKEPRVEPFKEGSAAENTLRVGARYKSDGSAAPIAEITVSKNGNNDEHVTWVVICTDEYEGTAMLNIEALPLLIEALQEVQAQIA